MTAPVRLCIGLGGPTRIPPSDEYLLEKASFWEKTMQIDKAQLLQLLRYKGQHDQAHEAQQELPDKWTSTSTLTSEAVLSQLDRSTRATRRRSRRPLVQPLPTLTTTAAGSPNLTPERLPAPLARPYRRPRKAKKQQAMNN
jgi:hypothetical protein